MGDQPFMKRVIHEEYSDDICGRIEELFGMCSSIQTTDMPDVIDITGYEDEFLAYSNSLIAMKNKEEDEYSRDMITRMAVKAVKFSALCAVFNSDGVDVRMDEDSFNWGIAMVEHELARNKENVEVVTDSDSVSYEDMIILVRQVIEDLLLSNVAKCYMLPLDEVDRGLVQISMIKRILKDNAVFKSCIKGMRAKSVSGLINDILKELRAEGELSVSGKSRGVDKYIRITAEFNLNR